MRARVVFVSLALAAAAAHADPPKHVIHAPPPPGAVGAELDAAVRKGHTADVVNRLAVPLAYDGLAAADDAKCKKQFGDRGTVKKAGDRAAFARCLAAASAGRFVMGIAADDTDTDLSTDIHVFVAKGLVTRVVIGNRSVEDPAEDGAEEERRDEDGVVNGVETSTTIPPDDLEHMRIAGTREIVPDDRTRAEMQKAGVTRLVASVKLCVSDHGDVASARVVKSSGYAVYDKAVVDAMRTWKYRPYVVNGTAIPLCSVVVLVIYTQN
jgi:TonB family protein